jgi:6-phosphogluconolactonase
VHDYLLYVGSYTHPAPPAVSTSRGIYSFRFDPKSGVLAPLGLAAETPNPAHLWASPDGRFLYTVNWRLEDATNGDTLSAYAVDRKSGDLTFLNKVRAHGDWANQIVLDPTGQVAITVCYHSGTIAALPVEANGRLGEAFYTEPYTGVSVGHDPPGPHPHGVVFSADGYLAYVAELGLDRVYSYRVDAARRAMKPLDPPYLEMKRGSGPRRLQLHPNGRYLYVNLETSSTVSVLEVNGGHLREIQSVSTLPAGFHDGNMTAEIQIDHTGRFLYVSNRGHDSIACYQVDPTTGKLTSTGFVPSQGRVPRNIQIDPTNRFLFVANQFGENVVVFRIDAGTGALAPAEIEVPVPQAGGMVFIPAQ